MVLCLASCRSNKTSPQNEPISEPSPEPNAPARIPVQSLGSVEAQVSASVTAYEAGEVLSGVNISSSSFNPNGGQKITVETALLRKAAAKIEIYDPDFMHVRTLESKGVVDAGTCRLSWDGKDVDGQVVPDEAYFFVVTATDAEGKIEVYDPTLFSGGEGKDVIHADIDPVTKAITYELPIPARVLIRQGVQDGPLFNTLVDWKPRVAGQITEHWNGKDQDGLVNLLETGRFKMLITYTTLPENSIITYGNRTQDYASYKKVVQGNRFVKERPTRGGVKISPHYLLARTDDHSPTVTMRFPDATKAGDSDLPVLKGKALVKVDLDEADRAFFADQQYEITLFLDTEFYTEQEVGYVPFNWVWDLSDVAEGEHLLTVNMTGFKDQIGVLSKKVRVVK